MTPLDRFLDACARRPLLTVAGVVGYALLVTATHDHVQDVAYVLQAAAGRDVWSPTVAVAGAAGFAVLAWAAIRRLRASPVGRAATAASVATAVALVAASLTLLATNMEAVHFVQYALPALPVYALTRRFGTTVVVVGVLGALDEVWQYVVLHASWGVPCDMNDIVLNALGASLGCACILVFATCAARDGDRGAWAAPAAAALVFGAGGVALHAAGLLALHPEDGPAPILLSRLARPESRWQEPEWGRAHHLVHPGLALVVCLAAAFGHAAIDRVAGWKGGARTP